MRKTCSRCLAFLLAWPMLAIAGQTSVVGAWNLPEHQGVLQLKEDGTFVSKRADNGHEINGLWRVVKAGKIVLMRGASGPGGQCDYTVTEEVLTFTHCPVEGDYTKVH